MYICYSASYLVSKIGSFIRELPTVLQITGSKMVTLRTFSAVCIENQKKRKKNGMYQNHWDTL